MLDEIARIEAALVRNLPEDRSEGSEEQRARWLMAHLLHYHRREEKPVWWAYFNRLEMSQEELVEDSEAIGELSRGPGRATDRRQALAHPHVAVPRAGAQACARR